MQEFSYSIVSFFVELDDFRLFELLIDNLVTVTETLGIKRMCSNFLNICEEKTENKCF